MGRENWDRTVAEISAERYRQINVEGWTPEHDDQHRNGELLEASRIYLWHGTKKAVPVLENGVPDGWPWEEQWWKPKGRRQNLIRAGALCLAEKERIIRAGGRLQTYRTRHGQVRRMTRADTGQVDSQHILIIGEIIDLDAASQALARAADPPADPAQGRHGDVMHRCGHCGCRLPDGRHDLCGNCALLEEDQMFEDRDRE